MRALEHLRFRAIDGLGEFRAALPDFIGMVSLHEAPVRRLNLGFRRIGANSQNLVGAPSILIGRSASRTRKCDRASLGARKSQTNPRTRIATETVNKARNELR